MKVLSAVREQGGRASELGHRRLQRLPCPAGEAQSAGGQGPAPSGEPLGGEEDGSQREEAGRRAFRHRKEG